MISIINKTLVKQKLKVQGETPKILIISTFLNPFPGEA
jgi:hypothetical protein